MEKENKHARNEMYQIPHSDGRVGYLPAYVGPDSGRVDRCAHGFRGGTKRTRLRPDDVLLYGRRGLSLRPVPRPHEWKTGDTDLLRRSSGVIPRLSYDGRARAGRGERCCCRAQPGGNAWRSVGRNPGNWRPRIVPPSRHLRL